MTEKLIIILGIVAGIVLPLFVYIISQGNYKKRGGKFKQ